MGEIAIVGGGVMGHGIALVLALAGHGVRLTDTRPETRARIPALMDSALATLREAGAAPEGGPCQRSRRRGWTRGLSVRPPRARTQVAWVSPDRSPPVGTVGLSG